MKRLAAVFAAAVLCTGIAQAQGPPPGAGAPPPPPEKGSTAGLLKEATASYTQIKGIILASADKMPAENFGFKPTADVRSYAELFNHVAQSSNGLCGAIGNAPMQRTPPITAATKDDVIAALKASFATCDAAIAGIAEPTATDISGGGYMRGSKVGQINKLVAHDNEMYGTMVVYMRLKGIVPPSTAMRGRM